MDVNSEQVGTWTINALSSGLPTGANLIGNVSVSVMAGLATSANNIGIVNVNTLVAGLPTGANLIGNVSISALPAVALTTGTSGIGIVNVSGGIIAQNAAYLTTNPLVTGGVYYATQPTINANSATWMSMTTRAGLIVATGVDVFSVTVAAGLPTGANVLGAVTQSGTWNSTINAGLPTGANNIGIVNVAGGIIAQNAAYLTTNPLVTGGVYYATQPTINANSVSWMALTTRAAQIVATGSDAFNVTVNAGLPTGANLIGNVSVSVMAGLATGANVIGLVNSNADAAIGAGTAPAKSLIVGGVYNSSLPSPTTGQTTAIQLDAAGRLICNTGSVTLGGLSTGANTIGSVFLAGAQVEVIPTVTAGAYTAGWVIGGIITFANILPASFLGMLMSIELKFKASLQTGEFDMAIFSTSPAGTFADHGAPAIAAGDSTLLLGVYRLIQFQSCLGTHTIYNLDGIFQRITGVSTSLYGVVITKVIPTNPASAADMLVRLSTTW